MQNRVHPLAVLLVRLPDGRVQGIPSNLADRILLFAGLCLILNRDMIVRCKATCLCYTIAKKYLKNINWITKSS